MGYWYSNPCALFNSFNIIPFLDSTPNESYNSLSRLIIVFTIIFAIFSDDKYFLILGIGIVSFILSLIIYLNTANDHINFKKKQKN